jgi:hypothetical protein
VNKDRPCNYAHNHTDVRVDAVGMYMARNVTMKVSGFEPAASERRLPMMVVS